MVTIAIQQTPEQLTQLLLTLQESIKAQPAAAPQAEEPVIGHAIDPRRERIRRMVGVLSVQLARSQQEVYIWSYHEFFKKTGYHPVVEAQCKGAHLDAVFRYSGGPEIMLAILMDKLQTDITPDSQFTAGTHEF